MRVSAARSLGARMDRAVDAVAHIPTWGFRLVLLIAVAATFPYGEGSVSILGLHLTNWFTIWMVDCVLVALSMCLIALAFFLTRAMVSYLEEGRWPKRAAGVDVGEVDGALDQVDRRSEDLSQAADVVRLLERQLRRADDVIRYLSSELERARGGPPPEQHEEDDRMAQSDE
jgi:hypothetical protein